jgi:hypothetical protein
MRGSLAEAVQRRQPLSREFLEVVPGICGSQKIFLEWGKSTTE